MEDIFRRFACLLFGIIACVFFSWLAMTKGYGVEVKSWGWIIGAGVFGQLLAGMFLQLANTKK